MTLPLSPPTSSRKQWEQAKNLLGCFSHSSGRGFTRFYPLLAEWVGGGWAAHLHHDLEEAAHFPMPWFCSHFFFMSKQWWAHTQHIWQSTSLESHWGWKKPLRSSSPTICIQQIRHDINSKLVFIPFTLVEAGRHKLTLKLKNGKVGAQKSRMVFIWIIATIEDGITDCSRNLWTSLHFLFPPTASNLCPHLSFKVYFS